MHCVINLRGEKQYLCHETDIVKSEQKLKAQNDSVINLTCLIQIG